ncbi:MAG: glycogen debranching enzyme, partial [Planctomycetota bacterium]|nr:glycogen debranching enzyme [Planctomycetota bacterium]
GKLVANPPLVEAIAEDPMLADTKIIAEAWDAAGAFQVGTFADLRWAEWNGLYRDDVRRYWRGDEGCRGKLATRLAGSSDLYEAGGRHPYHSINFITSHDGFPLNDLVSYSRKHNEANGEGNRDGDDNNYSMNYGVEGPTRRNDVNETRRRQIKNFMATLLLSQGVPMIVAGDECQRTQRGNNNAYCQDNEISWFDWTLVEDNADLIQFVRALIHFRKIEPSVRREEFLTGKAEKPGELPDVSWYDASGEVIDWEQDDQTLICLLRGSRSENAPASVYRHVLILFNVGETPSEFVLPTKARSFDWRQLVDTAAESPHDVFPDGDGPPLPRRRKVKLAGRSLVAYVADVKTPRRRAVGG